MKQLKELCFEVEVVGKKNLNRVFAGKDPINQDTQLDATAGGSKVGGSAGFDTCACACAC